MELASVRQDERLTQIETELDAFRSAMWRLLMAALGASAAGFLRIWGQQHGLF